ncbi:hypothetical protein ACOKS3_25035 [Pseudomonas sp. HS6-2]|uniref:hypothetical protein n=1 Tax=Pseudomonas sp. HS6-2 TaxID=3410986 RepID=UPI003BD3E93A
MNMSNNVTMTTVEIAELTGKAHKNVLADARKVAESIDGLKSQPVESSYKDKVGSFADELGTIEAMGYEVEA